MGPFSKSILTSGLKFLSSLLLLTIQKCVLLVILLSAVLIRMYAQYWAQYTMTIFLLVIPVHRIPIFFTFNCNTETYATACTDAAAASWTWTFRRESPAGH